MKRKTLEIKLQGIPNITDPKPELEQYGTPAGIAADILFTAFMDGNIKDRKVADLGTGSGILAIGASILGAASVFAYDIDEQVIEQARNNAKQIGMENIQFVTAEICGEDDHEHGGEGSHDHRDCRGPWMGVDTVIMNPPFGAQKPHADIPFLIKALEMGRIIYTIHQTNTLDHLRKRIPELGGSIEQELRTSFPIPHMFFFHEKEVKHIDVTILKISKTI